MGVRLPHRLNRGRLKDGRTPENEKFLCSLEARVKILDPDAVALEAPEAREAKGWQTSHKIGLEGREGCMQK